MKQMIEVWGLATGRNSTKEAARGAFTWRHYEPGNVPKEDWLLIMSIREVMADDAKGLQRKEKTDVERTI